MALLNENDGVSVGEWVSIRTSLFWDDVCAWSRYIYLFLLTHWPLGPIRTYPATESANFAVVNNEKTRIMTIARKKKEGAWRVGLRWLCLVLLGVLVALLYSFIHGSMESISQVSSILLLIPQSLSVYYCLVFTVNVCLYVYLLFISSFLIRVLSIR